MPFETNVRVGGVFHSQGIAEQPAAAGLLQVNFSGDWERKYCVLKGKTLACYAR